MPRSITTRDEVEWSGRIVAVQPRIRLKLFKLLGEMLSWMYRVASRNSPQ